MGRHRSSCRLPSIRTGGRSLKDGTHKREEPAEVACRPSGLGGAVPRMAHTSVRSQQKSLAVHQDWGCRRRDPGNVPGCVWLSGCGCVCEGSLAWLDWERVWVFGASGQWLGGCGLAGAALRGGDAKFPMVDFDEVVGVAEAGLQGDLLDGERGFGEQRLDL